MMEQVEDKREEHGNVINISVISKDQSLENVEEKSADVDTSSTLYQPHTFRLHSINSQRRLKLLPAYPRLGAADQQEKQHFDVNSVDRTILLLTNVSHIDRQVYEQDSYGGGGGQGICPFKFEKYRYVAAVDSFLIDFYRDLFEETSQRWKIPLSLIDYNLSRLRTCMDIYRKQTHKPAFASLDELPLALEFFLQIDVDVFFMKTCHFNGSHPRLFPKNDNDNSGDGDGNGRGRATSTKDEYEGILCRDTPVARYGMIPCRERNCILCRSHVETISRSSISSVVSFSSNESHRFVNTYETFLNCDADCNTSNVIYALTCRCKQYDFVGSTGMSFHDRILKQRDENNRIVREFLIGSNNIHHILYDQIRSAETLANNEMFVYQHSPRCSFGLQLFLDKNPDYWCLVPMEWNHARELDHLNTATSSSRIHTIMEQQPESSTSAKKPRLFEDVLRNSTRSEEECIWLVRGVPKAPSGYRFARRQIEEQFNFFKFKKDLHVLPSNLVDFYTYAIIAVLPDDSSAELRQFLEALFITHAETRLNTIGRLTQKGPWPQPLNDSNRGLWCEKLVRPSSHEQRICPNY